MPSVSRRTFGTLYGHQTHINAKEFLDNTQVLTNVSIWRNQATNRPLSPGNIPKVHPWQPGLRDGQRFCLTAVSLQIVFFRAGLTASHGGTPCGLCLGLRGRLGWPHTQHNVAQARTSRNGNSAQHQNKLINVIHEPLFPSLWANVHSWQTYWKCRAWAQEQNTFFNLVF